MSEHTSPIQRSQAKTNEQVRSIESHLDVLGALTYDAECAGAVPLASDPDNRYPYAYPRDIACITRAWLESVEAGFQPQRSRDHILESARFMLAVQEDDGRWRQRYSLDGDDVGIYIQEDNVAHGLRILGHAVEALEATDTLDELDDAFYTDLVAAVDAAVTHTRDELYDPNATLIESTTSIHEGRIESGYTLWVNCTFLSGLRDVAAALATLPDRIESADVEAATRDLAAELSAGLERTFTTLPQIPRRYTPDGDPDFRPDVTLFAPYYYGLDDIFGTQAVSAAERAGTALEDPRLGGLQRFLGFYRDFEAHQHGGNGPWMQYTAWNAQFQFDQGNVEEGESILDTIAAHTDEQGHIPEHLTTRARLTEFMEKEWQTRRDFEKEFDEEVLRDVPFDFVVEELGHMQSSYEEMLSRTESQDVIGFARPLTWSHAETLRALLRRD